jgi:copper chaperone CopZ
MNKTFIFITVALVLAGVISLRLAAHNLRPVPTIQATNTDSLRHLVLRIDGMYCVSCPYNVENALKDTPGVMNATVGFVGKEIVNGTVEGRGEVVYDSTKTNPDKMIQAILPYKGATLTDEKTNSTKLTPLSKTFSL